MQHFLWVMAQQCVISGTENGDQLVIVPAIWGPEKSLADVFKYRNKIGADVALESLKLYRRRRKFDADKLLYYARICRVENVMRPYLETLI